MNQSVFLQERTRIFLFFRKTKKNEACSAMLFHVFDFAVFPEKRTFDRKLHCFPWIWRAFVFLVRNYPSVPGLVAVSLTIIKLRY